MSHKVNEHITYATEGSVSYKCEFIPNEVRDLMRLLRRLRRLAMTEGQS